MQRDEQPRCVRGVIRRFDRFGGVDAYSVVGQIRMTIFVRREGEEPAQSPHPIGERAIVDNAERPCGDRRHDDRTNIPHGDDAVAAEAISFPPDIGRHEPGEVRPRLLEILPRRTCVIEQLIPSFTAEWHGLALTRDRRPKVERHGKRRETQSHSQEGAAGKRHLKGIRLLQFNCASI
jgi:hypothetical protein